MNYLYLVTWENIELHKGEIRCKSCHSPFGEWEMEEENKLLDSDCDCLDATVRVVVRDPSVSSLTRQVYGLDDGCLTGEFEVDDSIKAFDLVVAGFFLVAVVLSVYAAFKFLVVIILFMPELIQSMFMEVPNVDS